MNNSRLRRRLGGPTLSALDEASEFVGLVALQQLGPLES